MVEINTIVALVNWCKSIKLVNAGRLSAMFVTGLPYRGSGKPALLLWHSSFYHRQSESGEVCVCAADAVWPGHLGAPVHGGRT